MGGKGGAGPSSQLHPNAQGTNGREVCECEMDVESTWTPTWHRMDRVSWSLGLFSKIHRGFTSCQVEHHVQAKFATPILYAIDQF